MQKGFRGFEFGSKMQSVINYLFDFPLDCSCFKGFSELKMKIDTISTPESWNRRHKWFSISFIRLLLLAYQSLNGSLNKHKCDFSELIANESGSWFNESVCNWSSRKVKLLKNERPCWPQKDSKVATFVITSCITRVNSKRVYSWWRNCWFHLSYFVYVNITRWYLRYKSLRLVNHSS